MDRWKRWDIQLSLATLVLTGFAAISAFTAAELALRYSRLANSAITDPNRDQLAAARSVDGWVFPALRVAALAALVLVAVTFRRYKAQSGISVELRRPQTMIMKGLVALTAGASLIAFLSLPALSTACPCRELRDLHTDAMLSLVQAPTAMIFVVLLWMLRSEIRKQLAASPHESHAV